MKRISINKLRGLYRKISEKKTIKPYFQKGIFNYLNLSVHFSREDREFDLVNYDLFKDLVITKKIDLRKIKNNYSKYSYANYFFNFKEFHYLLSKEIPFLIFRDILKFIKQLIDILLIFIIIFFSSFRNYFKKLFLGNFKLISKKIYSIYYWEDKGENSDIYYYPDIKNKIENISFISSFADSNFLFLGLLKSLSHKTYLSAANIMDFKILFISVFQFMHLYFNDLTLVIFNKNCRFIKFWFGWKKCAEIFFSILVYNSIIKLVKESSNCEFISWHENQFSNRAFSLGVSYASRKFNSLSKLSTYNGSPISKQNKKQFFPDKLEVIRGFWGNKYYVQDPDSKGEMDSYFKKENINIEVQIVPRNMKRIMKIEVDNSKLVKGSREITIFSHDSYWDLIACLLSVIKFKNKSQKATQSIIDNMKFINIRLHPCLNKKEALRRIFCIKEIPKNLRINFINNNKESIIDSINKSSFCFFGLSSYINLAMSLNSNVISVNTNHIDNSPINSKFRESRNLVIFNPW